MIDIDIIDAKKRKELVIKLMEKEADFKELRKKLDSKEPVETSGVEYVPEDWLKKVGIVVGFLTENEKNFIYVIYGPVIRGEKLTERRNRYLESIIDRCKLLKRLENSPLYEEYRKERDKLI